MPDPIRTCVIVKPPQTVQPAAAPAPTPPTPLEAAILRFKKWPTGTVLRVAFLDGDPFVQQRVEAVAHQWSKYADIRFLFGPDPNAEIRVSFAQEGSWSYIGTDCRSIPKNQPTMNYGWLTPDTNDEEYERVVLHEFGHALGLIHEHQNPAGGIPWDKDAVYDYYQGPPNNWTRAQVDTNLFQTYSKTETNFTAFDPGSIMLYPIPNEFTVGDFEVGWNRMLSATDIDFIAMQYPKPGNELTVDGAAREAQIGAFGEVDIYTFVVTAQGRYRAETSGRTDLVMTLFGPNNDGLFIAEDDDSGRGLNPRLVRDLEPGKYTLRVRHWSRVRTGEYTISVKKEG